MKILLFITALIVSISSIGVQPVSIPQSSNNLPVLLGIYPDKGDISTTTALNNWLINNSGGGLSLSGTFVDITNLSISNILSNIYQNGNGYIPFVNVMIGNTRQGSLCKTVEDIMNYLCDTDLNSFANGIIQWHNLENGYFYLAFLPEMNGLWVSQYYRNGIINPTNYISAYLYVKQYLSNKGITYIKWVFAPDAIGSSYPFEQFYAGHNNVDVLAFSRFNLAASCGGTWANYTTDFLPYLQRMTTLDNSKPIFIAQTGMSVDSSSQSSRSQWIVNTFTLISQYPALRAILYFNQQTTECGGYTDWRAFVYGETGHGEDGLLQISKLPQFYKWSTTNENWSTLAFYNFPDVFSDTYRINPMTGITDYINIVYTNGITTGCSTNPPMFCPNSYISRAQIAVFLLKIKYGSAYIPPSPTQYFTDVPNSYWASSWIDELYREGIVGGCGNNNYCPDNFVTRDAIAVFLLKTKYGGTYSPPPSAQIFQDVLPSNWAFNWINKLYVEGITSGCGNNNYCPLISINRKDAATLLVKTFNLP